MSVLRVIQPKRFTILLSQLLCSSFRSWSWQLLILVSFGSYGQMSFQGNIILPTLIINIRLRRRYVILFRSLFPSRILLCYFRDTLKVYQTISVQMVWIPIFHIITNLLDLQPFCHLSMLSDIGLISTPHSTTFAFQVIKMVCIMLVAFIICWVPLQIVVLYSQFFHSSGDGAVSNNPFLLLVSLGK